MTPPDHSEAEAPVANVEYYLPSTPWQRCPPPAIDSDPVGLLFDADADAALATEDEIDAVFAAVMRDRDPEPEPEIEPEPEPESVKRERKTTLAAKRITKSERQILALLYPERPQRPRTRRDCVDAVRPCPWVGCRHNTYLEASRTGITMRVANLEVWDVDPATSCSLDVAARGPHTLDDVGEIMNLTRERIRQIELAALAQIRQDRAADVQEIADLIAELSLSEALGSQVPPFVKVW